MRQSTRCTTSRSSSFSARNLPGVTFRCATGMVHIDHVFAHGRYFALLDRFLVHARRWLTTEALSRY